MYQCLVGIACLLASLALVRTQDANIAGDWRLNPEVSSPASRADDGQWPEGSSALDVRRARAIMGRLKDPPASLTIVRDGVRVILADDEGRTSTYAADGRAETRVSDDGESTSRAQFEGEILVVEEDFGGGVTLTSRYEPVAGEGAQFLEVTLMATGLVRPRRASGVDLRNEVDAPRSPASPSVVLRVYERAPSPRRNHV